MYFEKKDGVVKVHSKPCHVFLHQPNVGLLHSTVSDYINFVKSKIYSWTIVAVIPKTNQCISISTEVTDICFKTVIRNVKDCPNYGSGGLLVTVCPN